MIKQEPLFIHIPKTGGTSIKNALINKNLYNWKRNPRFINHDPLFTLLQNNKIDENIFTFSVVRNPFTRAFSYFKHFKKVNQIQCHFSDFLTLVKLKGSNAFYPNLNLLTPMIFFDQSFFLYDFVDKEKFTINKIYHFENLMEVEEDLKIKIDHHNKGNYTDLECIDSYSDNEIKMVKELYYRDFKNFNYNAEFNL